MRRRTLFAICTLMLPALAPEAGSDPLQGAESPPLATTPPPGQSPLAASPAKPRQAAPLVTPGESPGVTPDSTAQAAAAATVDTSTSAPGGHAESPANGSLSTTGPAMRPSNPGLNGANQRP